VVVEEATERAGQVKTERLDIFPSAQSDLSIETHQMEAVWCIYGDRGIGNTVHSVRFEIE
jgi:hypothetical protein